jgi:hypothetical protein
MPFFSHFSKNTNFSTLQVFAIKLKIRCFGKNADGQEAT